MIENVPAQNVLGTMGAICWSIQVIPQIYKSHREKSTEGLSEWLMLIWICASIFLGPFTILKRLSIPLVVQPQSFGFLAAVSWAQCMRYGRNRSLTVTISMFVTLLAVVAAIQVGVVYTIRSASAYGNELPVQAIGIASIVLIASGMMPQYFEIWRFGEVKGISITFMIVDVLGGVFSFLSLIFRSEFDVVASIAYTLVIFLDGFVILCALILNPRARRRRESLQSVANNLESQPRTVVREVVKTDGELELGSDVPDSPSSYLAAATLAYDQEVAKEGDDSKTLSTKPSYDTV